MFNCFLIINQKKVSSIYKMRNLTLKNIFIISFKNTLFLYEC